MLKYKYTVAKSKNLRRGTFQVFYFSWATNLIGIFNGNSRKIVSKFSGLRCSLVFEDLYNGKGSLQANKTSKKQNLNLKQ